jgi:hypothetical protein
MLAVCFTSSNTVLKHSPQTNNTTTQQQTKGVVIAAVSSSKHAVECRRGLPWSEETVWWYGETVGSFSTLCYTYDEGGVHADDDDEYHDEFER